MPFGFVKTAIVPDPNPYDLERIEVLRGPQGSYGATALNGVVRVLTKDADLRTTSSSRHGHPPRVRKRVARTIARMQRPMSHYIPGKLAVRASMGYQSLSGWIDKPTGKDANDAEIRNARVKINAQPTEQLSIGLSAWISRDDFAAPNVGGEDLTNPSLLDESIAMDYDAYGVKVGYQANGFWIVSNTSYLEFRNKSQLDVAAGVPGLDLRLYTNLPARTFAEELLLNPAARAIGAGPWEASIAIARIVSGRISAHLRRADQHRQPF